MNRTFVRIMYWLDSLSSLNHLLIFVLKLVLLLNIAFAQVKQKDSEEHIGTKLQLYHNSLTCSYLSLFIASVYSPFSFVSFFFLCISLYFMLLYFVDTQLLLSPILCQVYIRALSLPQYSDEYNLELYFAFKIKFSIRLVFNCYHKSWTYLNNILFAIICLKFGGAKLRKDPISWKERSCSRDEMSFDKDLCFTL